LGAVSSRPSRRAGTSTYSPGRPVAIARSYGPSSLFGARRGGLMRPPQ
jgi:hypothetical protein